MKILLRGLMLLVAVSALGGCAVMKWVGLGGGPDFTEGPVAVKEIRRALFCDTPDSQSVVRLFDSANELVQWDSFKNNLQLGVLRLPQDRAYVVLEQGYRKDSGYTVEIENTARLTEEGVLHITANFVEPGPDQRTAPVATSVCVLAAVPQQPYTQVVVWDKTNRKRAELMLQRD